MSLANASNHNHDLERTYSELPDFIIVYKNYSNLDDLEAHLAVYRKAFLQAVEQDGLKYHTEEITTTEGTVLTIIKITTPFQRLCKEAERIRLKLPIKSCETFNYSDDQSKNCFTKLFKWCLHKLQSDENIIFASAPFQNALVNRFEGSDDPKTFFRPAQRIYLTYNILINIDIRTEEVKSSLALEDITSRKGLPFMLHSKAFKDAFPLHDLSLRDPAIGKLTRFCEHLNINDLSAFNQVPSPNKKQDTRHILDAKWTKLYKFQPLHRVRNYFGEKIGLYFAWSGELASSLWIPTLIGIGIFVFGITDSFGRVFKKFNNSTRVTETDPFVLIKEDVFGALRLVKISCDNVATPFFALLICVWGTVFLEMWKRCRARLSYEWDCESFKETEPDRPEFVGTQRIPDPVIPGEFSSIYPVRLRLFKYLISATGLIVMILVVFVSAIGVIIYRVIVFINYCAAEKIDGRLSSVECMFSTSVASALMNTVSIIVLGKIYDLLAYQLTEWENHRSSSEFEDALVIKLFAFQFANSYASLFYVAFVRGRGFQNGVFNLGSKYQDDCGSVDDGCMAVLSIQVLAVMITKPLVKFFFDIVKPFMVKAWRHRNDMQLSDVNRVDEIPLGLRSYEYREYRKPKLGNFTMDEYTEKVIQYGYLMLFAASLPLAPLIALITNIVDLSVDGKRMLWVYQRPVPEIASNIGIWYGILEFLNLLGVVTNAFLIFFTSSFGNLFTNITDKLWGVIIVEHCVLAFKFALAFAIPDIPADIRLSMRREKYQIDKVMHCTDEQFKRMSAERSRTRLAALRMSAIAGNRTSKTREDLYVVPPKIPQPVARNTLTVPGFNESRSMPPMLNKKPSRPIVEPLNQSNDKPTIGPVIMVEDIPVTESNDDTNRLRSKPHLDDDVITDPVAVNDELLKGESSNSLV